jgi:hypothetical protein
MLQVTLVVTDLLNSVRDQNTRDKSKGDEQPITTLHGGGIQIIYPFFI